MAPCCETPMIRIEKIKKNQIVNPGSSPYNQMPQVPGSAPQNNNVLPADEMTPIVNPQPPDQSSIFTPGSDVQAPELIPNAPTFAVPPNPLLPEGYREVLSYNNIQYVNGFYRTQIGRFVRVEQLMGSNTIETRQGYLIGVGINFIILQETTSGNIEIIDIYGIKSMYVFYNFGTPPQTRSMEAGAELEETPE